MKWTTTKKVEKAKNIYQSKKPDRGSSLQQALHTQVQQPATKVAAAEHTYIITAVGVAMHMVVDQLNVAHR